jgi:putative ABC transport system permease protein
MIPISYNIRSLKERQRTTIATALGIALVVFVLSASMMLSSGIDAAMGLSGREDVAVVLRKGTDSELGSSVPSEQIARIVSGPGVKQNQSGNPSAAGELVVVATLELEDAEPGQISNVQIRGVPDNVLDFRKDARLIEGRPARPGTDEVIIGKRIRGSFIGVDLGKEFELKKNRPAKVVGVFEAGGSMSESEVWADLETLRSAFGRGAMVSSVRVELESPDRFEAFRDSVEHDKSLGLAAFRESNFLEMQSEGTAIFVTALGTVVAAFFSFGAIIGAMITMFAAVAQRRREVGVLRALGFSPFSILSSFILESLLLALIGGLIGAVASMAMGAVEFSMLNFATFSQIVFKFTPSVGILLTALIFAVIMGVVGGLFPAFQAARVSPIEAMRN